MGQRRVRRRPGGRAKLAGPRPARAARARGRAAGGRSGDRGADRKAVQSTRVLSHAKARYAEAEPLIAVRWRSTRRATGRIIPTWRQPQQSRESARRHEPPRRGRAAYRRALAIDEASYGPDHPNVAIRLNNLASCSKTRTASARPSRSIAARWRSTRRATGRIIPTWRSASTISRACSQDTNRPGEAEPLYRRALAIDEGAMGRIIPMWRAGLNNLALCSKPRTASARPSRFIAARSAIDEASYGPDHPNVATASTISRACSDDKPPRRSRAAIAPRARDRREEPMVRIIQMWRIASTISRACSRNKPPQRG